MTELETGGNIRFEEGKPTDKWFSSCVDLVRSRFNPETMKFFGIIGINVTRVTRIHNRFLRNRFEEKLEKFQGNLYRSAVEMAKDWRTDKMLRRLEAMLVVMDMDQSLLWHAP